MVTRALRHATLIGALLSAPLAANPVVLGADPHAVVIGQEYWLFPTDSLRATAQFVADRFNGFSSRDLRTWRRRGELIDIDDIRWIKDDGAKEHFLWAPAVLPHAGRYYLYYSVGPQDPTPSRIGVAVARRPEGPYRDSGKPLLTGGNGFEAIDPMVYIDPKSGTPYMYAGGSNGATLRVYALKPSLTEIAREVKVDQPPHFTEGAFMHERNGVYYLSYSSGKWNEASYSVHYATATTPTGPWTYRGAILTSDATRKGPGHHSFFRNPTTDQWYIAYHRWPRTDARGPFTGVRQSAIETISYTADGAIAPVMMTDTRPQPSPIR